MKFEQLKKRHLRLEKWFKKYQDIVHSLLKKINEISDIHRDIVKRYSEMQKTLDEILVRQKQEESFRNYVRSEIKSIHTQVELNQEAFDELDDSHNSILKCIKTSKKLMKLFNLEEK